MATNAIYGNMGIHDLLLLSLKNVWHNVFPLVIPRWLHSILLLVPHPFHGHSLFIPLVFHECYLFVPRRFTIRSPNDPCLFTERFTNVPQMFHKNGKSSWFTSCRNEVSDHCLFNLDERNGHRCSTLTLHLCHGTSTFFWKSFVIQGFRWWAFLW